MLSSRPSVSHKKRMKQLLLVLKGTKDLAAPVVRKVDSAIHWINLYPVNINSIGFACVYVCAG